MQMKHGNCLSQFSLSLPQNTEAARFAEQVKKRFILIRSQDHLADKHDVLRAEWLGARLKNLQEGEFRQCKPLSKRNPL